jgi:hypothetical protein
MLNQTETMTTSCHIAETKQCCGEQSSAGHEVFATTMAEWVQEISAAFSRGRENAMALAKVVWTAKRKLLFGQWTALWRSGGIPFSKRKGEMLVVIWKGLGSLNAQVAAHLPSSWSTLYLLAQFDSKVLVELSGQGKVHPALTIQEARNLLSAVNTRHRPGRSQVQRRLSSFKDFVHSALNNWTVGERDLVQDGLLQLAREVAHSAAVLQRNPYLDFDSGARVERSRCPSISESRNHCNQTSQITPAHSL